MCLDIIAKNLPRFLLSYISPHTTSQVCDLLRAWDPGRVEHIETVLLNDSVSWRLLHSACQHVRLDLHRLESDIGMSLVHPL